MAQGRERCKDIHLILQHDIDEVILVLGHDDDFLDQTGTDLLLNILDSCEQRC